MGTARGTAGTQPHAATTWNGRIVPRLFAPPLGGKAVTMGVLCSPKSDNWATWGAIPNWPSYFPRGGNRLLRVNRNRHQRP